MNDGNIDISGWKPLLLKNKPCIMLTDDKHVQLYNAQRILTLQKEKKTKKKQYWRIWNSCYFHLLFIFL